LTSKCLLVFNCLMKKICFFLLLIACNPYRRGPADMQYLIHDDRPGPTIQQGDILFLHFIHRTEKDSLLASSYLSDQPVLFTQQKPLFKGDIFTGLQLLSEGDSATFKLNFDSMQVILDVPKPAHIKDKYLLFTVKVLKVVSGSSSTIYALRQSIGLQRCLAEEDKIRSYIGSRGFQRTASGLYYMVNQQGSGALPATGDTVKFAHVGRSIKGRIFDTSIADTAKKAGIFDERRPYTPGIAVVGDSSTIPGIDEALALFPAGSSVTLVVPSALAYGARGNAGFLPYTPLVFDLNILHDIH
jgi:FKBP-type peptidyl-prolyl cis-trans isomerase FkpA